MGVEHMGVVGQLLVLSFSRSSFYTHTHTEGVG